MRWLICSISVAVAFADTGGMQRAVVERLGKEADKFEASAHRLAGVETLRQRLPRGTRIERTARGTETVLPEVTHEIVSEYGFVSLDEPGGSIKEVRLVRTVNGLQWTKGTKGLDSLAMTLTAKNEKQKRRLLEGFESFGLRGFVTDLGQLILLFSRGRTGAYEIVFERKENDISHGRLLVYRYQQMDGPEALTVYEGDTAIRDKLRGFLWVTEKDYRPVRISLHSEREIKESRIRDDAAVDYRPSSFGCLVPSAVSHRQYVDGDLYVEDEFTYSGFKEILPGGRQ